MYAAFGQVINFRTLPVDAEVVIPSGTALYVPTASASEDEEARTMRRAVAQDTFTVPLAEPVDVIFEEAPAPVEPEPVPLVTTTTAKSEEEPWYKTPAFIGGVLSVLAFSAIAFLQSRAEAKVK